MFERIKHDIANPVSAEYSIRPPKPERQASTHRRALSGTASGEYHEDSLESSRLPLPQAIERRLSHNRSTSLPSRKAMFEDLDPLDVESDTSSDAPTPVPNSSSTFSTQRPILPPLTTSSRRISNGFLSPQAATWNRSSMTSEGSEGAGWWDVVSAVDQDRQSSSSLPWQSPSVSPDNRPGPLSQSGPRDVELASPIKTSFPLSTSFNKLDLDFSASPSSPIRQNYPIPEGSPAKRAMQRGMASSPGSSPGSESSPRNTPNYRPPPIPLNFDRPNFPSPPVGTVPIPSPSAEPDRSPPPPTKSKLGGFGRSLSIASKTMLARSKEKEREKENNVPGKWNKDMVANIMGPPVERR